MTAQLSAISALAAPPTWSAIPVDAGQADARAHDVAAAPEFDFVTAAPALSGALVADAAAVLDSLRVAEYGAAR